MEPIICDGHWSEDNQKYLFSMSSIFSYLIRECGKLVEDYNADILYDLSNIDDYVFNGTNEPCEKTFWIGLRESGVDHEEFIKCRVDSEYYYRGLYKIIVEKTKKKCIVTLKKSSAWDFKKEHENERN